MGVFPHRMAPDGEPAARVRVDRSVQPDRAAGAIYEATRERLLRVAFDVLWDSSYGSVSVDDICRRAEVNKGSFYHFFPSKADLAVEAYEEHWREMQPVFDRIFSREISPLERIRQWCALVYDVQKEKAEHYGKVCGCPYASLGAELATQDEKIRSRSERLLMLGRKYLEGAIGDAIKEGVVTVTDPVSATQRAHSVCLGMLLDAKVQNNLGILRDLEPAVMEIIGASELPAALTQ
jgi:TetR/AcrR family transcriptional repressor of nem operon